MVAGSGIGGWGHLPFRRVFCKKSGGKIFDGFDQRPAKYYGGYFVIRVQRKRVAPD